MSSLTQLLNEPLVPAGIGAGVYAVTVATVALTAVLARRPERRRDARETLKILLRRRPANH